MRKSNIPIPVEPGRRFGRLTLICEAERTNPRHRRVLCVCDCGVTKSIDYSVLKQGKQVSCGCFGKEQVKYINITHGLRRSPEYRSWSLAKNRCFNPNDKYYARYGGRGIKFSERWLNSFQTFYEDMGPKPSPAHVLDRIDNDGDYCAENCRWATPSESACNRRTSCRITFNGETRTVAEWTRLLGLPPCLISHRISYGWPVERLFEPPMKPGKPGGPGRWVKG